MSLVAAILAGPCAAAVITVEDFEGIPYTYQYYGTTGVAGSGENLGSYLPNLLFGPYVTVMDRSICGWRYNSTDYPPHSGDAVIWAAHYNYIRVDFLAGATSYVEFWYTSAETVDLKAYDAASNMVGAASGVANYPGQNSFLSLSAQSIAYIIISVPRFGSCLTIDDSGYVDVISVQIDIKPGTAAPNPINPSSSGVIPVAILTTADFDAADVDWTTVSLAGSRVAVRGKSNWMGHFEDVDGDGDEDLVVQVQTRCDGATWISGEVVLEGETWGGQPIRGSDTIVVVPER